MVDQTEGIYLRTDSPYWQYCYQMRGQKQVRRSTGTSDKLLAKKVYLKKRAEAQDVFHGFAKPKITLGDLLARYLKYPTVRKLADYYNKANHCGSKNP